MRDCVSYHQHHVFGCKHHTLDCTKWSLINYIVFTFIAKQRCLVVCPLHQWMDWCPSALPPFQYLSVLEWWRAEKCQYTRKSRKQTLTWYITCLVVNTMVHVQVVLGLLICGVLIDGVQVHSALECHKTRCLDHMHVTLKRDVVLELITWAVSVDAVDVHRGLECG